MRFLIFTTSRKKKMLCSWMMLNNSVFSCSESCLCCVWSGNLPFNGSVFHAVPDCAAPNSNSYSSWVPHPSRWNFWLCSATSFCSVSFLPWLMICTILSGSARKQSSVSSFLSGNLPNWADETGIRPCSMFRSFSSMTFKFQISMSKAL